MDHPITSTQHTKFPNVVKVECSRSTDQDGSLRVGKYSQLTQGTGTVTFAVQLHFSNLDGIGFKRGVVVSESVLMIKWLIMHQTQHPIESL